MNVNQFAEAAEKVRGILVKLTIVRGHEFDDANDIVTESIIKCLGSASKCKTQRDVEQLLKTVTFRESSKWHRDKNFQSSIVQRLSEHDENGEVANSLVHDDQAELRDLKIDVGHALSLLSEDDRELARLIFIEGWTYREAWALFSDKYSSHSDLYRHVQESVLPVLRSSLSSYKSGSAVAAERKAA